MLLTEIIFLDESVRPDRPHQLFSMDDIPNILENGPSLDSLRSARSSRNDPIRTYPIPTQA
jgi:hypothetical protein